MLSPHYALPLASLLSLVGLAGCPSEDSSRGQSKDEVQAALQEHAEDVEAAKQQDDPSDEIDEMHAANRELAEAVSDAPAQAADADANGETSVGPDNRFKLLDKESKDEFVVRAEGKIAALQRELAGIKGANVDPKDVTDVEETLDEARKDLDEVEHGSEQVVDDGKLGVTVAINSARRKIDRIQNDLADAK